MIFFIVISFSGGIAILLYGIRLAGEGLQKARQVAAAHILFKILGVSVFYPFMGLFQYLIEYTASDVPRQIANAHTLFNIAIAIMFLPFADPHHPRHDPRDGWIRKGNLYIY